MIRIALPLLLLAAAEMSALAAPQLGIGVRVTVPPSLVFQIPNVQTATTAGPTTVTFDLVVLLGQALRISVKADSDLTLPGGTTIAASDITWTASGAVNGVGMNGTLSKTTFTTVYQSQANATSGRVDLTWTLAAQGTSVNAGTRQAALRWKFEAVTP